MALQSRVFDTRATQSRGIGLMWCKIREKLRKKSQVWCYGESNGLWPLIIPQFWSSMLIWAVPNGEGGWCKIRLMQIMVMALCSRCCWCWCKLQLLVIADWAQDADADANCNSWSWLTGLKMLMLMQIAIAGHGWLSSQCPVTASSTVAAFLHAGLLFRVLSVRW